MSEKKCPCCGASLDFNSTECKYCGEVIAVQQPQAAPQYQAPVYQQPAYEQPVYQQPQYQAQPNYNTSGKSKTTAGVLGILLGGFGVHKFYLGKIGLGILYLLFCWTYIPAIVGFIEGIIYLCSSEENFYRKYVKK